MAHKSGQLPGVRHDAAVVYGPRGQFVVVGLTNHLADAGVPAARARALRQRDGLWYEVLDVASGADTYAGVDTWEPFFSDAHVDAAGRMLARLHRAGKGFEPRRPQPQAGFVVQIELCRLSPVAAAGYGRGSPEASVTSSNVPSPRFRYRAPFGDPAR